MKTHKFTSLDSFLKFSLAVGGLTDVHLATPTHTWSAPQGRLYVPRNGETVQLHPSLFTNPSNIRSVFVEFEWSDDSHRLLAEHGVSLNTTPRDVWRDAATVRAGHMFKPVDWGTDTQESVSERYHSAAIAAIEAKTLVVALAYRLPMGGDITAYLKECGKRGFDPHPEIVDEIVNGYGWTKESIAAAMV